MVHYSIVVSGKVQGVGYRFTCRDEARSLGIKGYVKNNTDGSVQIEAESTREKLQIFLVWCRKGPFRAVIKNIEIQEATVENHPSFEIR